MVEIIIAAFFGPTSLYLFSNHLYIGGTICFLAWTYFVRASGFSTALGKPMPAGHLKGGQLLKVIALAENSNEVVALKYPFGPTDVVCFRYDQKMRSTLQIGYKYVWCGVYLQSVV